MLTRRAFLFFRIDLSSIRFTRTGKFKKAVPMKRVFSALYSEDGQDIAEYAVMVAVILLIVVGTLRLIGSNSNTVFSSVASAIG